MAIKQLFEEAERWCEFYDGIPLTHGKSTCGSCTLYIFCILFIYVCSALLLVFLGARMIPQDATGLAL